MIKIARLGHALFATPDVAATEAYYNAVLGLETVARDAGRVYLATPQGQIAVILERSAATDCTAIALEAEPGVPLADMARSLTARGIASDLRSDPGPGLPQVLRITDPKGTVVDITQNRQRQSVSFGTGRPIAPVKLGHIAFKTPDVPAAVAFYREVLGFRVSDWRGDFFVFMRCGPDHHTVNFLRGPAPRMHHIAFELADGPAMLRACDHLGLAGHPVIWGPGRHLIGGNMFTYHRNPDQQIMEFYTDLAQMKNEALGVFEPRPWHVDAVYRPKDWPADASSNLWGPPSPPGFREG